jgi:hypothetical protein
LHLENDHKGAEFVQAKFEEADCTIRDAFSVSVGAIFSPVKFNPSNL